jgi:hypothetical protein
MENKRTQVKVAMNYGTLNGLAGVALTLLFYFIGTDMQSKIPQLTGYAVLILFIVMGIKSYRDEDLGGYISYGKSLGTGTLISLFGGIISAIFIVIFFTYIAPELPQQILEGTQQKLAERGMNEEQIEQAMSMTKKFMSPVILFIFGIVGTVFMGFIFSLIISIFMKKESNPFNSNIG